MSKHDSSLSKEQFNLLKDFKNQISNPHPRVEPAAPAITTAEPEPADAFALFQQDMRGVQQLDPGNIAQVNQPTKKKLDAQTLAKRAAAEGPMQTDETILSDTQAMLNPVGSQASLSYRIATLQHKVL
ncbi:hypothetical protein [Citrobacter portucalensis]|uniref:hypothetical protein n=1 Tax=Citrobacter portucalensis TaxID=1639133 RepID=UPI001C9EA04D|nr:hypothetical protein [Citrobacter portucalensis]